MPRRPEGPKPNTAAQSVSRVMRRHRHQRHRTYDDGPDSRLPDLEKFGQDADEDGKRYEGKSGVKGRPSAEARRVGEVPRVGDEKVIDIEDASEKGAKAGR